MFSRARDGVEPGIRDPSAGEFGPESGGVRDTREDPGVWKRLGHHANDPLGSAHLDQVIVDDCQAYRCFGWVTSLMHCFHCCKTPSRPNRFSASLFAESPKAVASGRFPNNS